MWLPFTTSDLSGTAKIAYAAGTYILAGVFYTGIQTAITSILPNLSRDPSERIVLNTFCMVGGNVGAFICMTFTLPLVAFFGGGDDQFGFSATLAFFGIIAIILFIVAFKNLREVNVEKIKKIPVKDSVRAIKGNWPWVILVTANLIFWIGSFLVGLMFPIMTAAFSQAAVFAIFGVVCLVGVLFVTKFVPETRGRILEEIEAQGVR